MILLLFPHQLFDKEVRSIIKTRNIQEVVMWEDPVFFGDRKGSAHGSQKLRLNRMRILYMRVATKMYVEWLQDLKVQVTHIEVDSLWKVSASKCYATLKHYDSITAFDPMDHLLMKRLTRANVAIEWMDSPYFLMTSKELQNYHQKREGRRLQHSAFFEFVKKKMGVLEGVKSTDAGNRSPYPMSGGPSVPDPHVELHNQRHRQHLWDTEVTWLETTPFWKNPGPITDPQLPMTHTEVKRWLDKFLKERFEHFGKYEDAVVSGHQWMFHSGLSVYLNMGLITPQDVVDAVRAKNASRRVDVANFEGFLRQLMGWREYARYYYEFVAPSTYLKNVFGCKKKLTSEWYKHDGTPTGIDIVDEAVRDAWNYGYLHHIRRLMVLSNYMMLKEVSPSAVFAWMYEFSLDSWDWVMVFNVYSMGTWSDGGHAMRKPYISSASYLQKMARMKDRRAIEEWNALFKAFVRKHADVLKHTQLAGIVRKSL